MANAYFDKFILYINVENNYSGINIIVLTETWHSVEDCNFKIPGYRLYLSSIKRNQNDGIKVFILNYK